MEVEDWNEYGELKQHVTMYYDEFTTPSKPAAPRSAVPTPSGTPSKPAVSQKENEKPIPTKSIAESSKPVEAAVAPIGGQATAFSLAMRQVGQEAAQKAKEVKKKAAETFVGVGKAEPEQPADKEEVKVATVPPFLPTEPKPIIATKTLFQCPTTTAWNRDWHDEITKHSITKVESLQSPNSTSWKPVEFVQPVTSYRGSAVTTASPECIKQVEEDSKIPEEDEEDEDEGDDDDDDDDDEEEDEDGGERVTAKA